MALFLFVGLSLCLAVAFVLWLSLAVAVGRREGFGSRSFLLSLLPPVAPVIGWNEGLRKRALAAGVALAGYLVLWVVAFASGLA
jgi:hypothetical protein